MQHLDLVVLLEFLRNRARAGRAADHHFFQVRQFQVVGFKVLQQHQPHGGHRGGEGHAIGIEQFVDRGAVELGARHHHGGADHRRGQSEPPAIGVEHRHHRHDDVARGDPHGVELRRHHRVQHVGAVRIDHAFGIACCARRVAHAGRGIFVKGFPNEVAVDVGDPLLVRHRILQCGRRHMRRAGQHHVFLDRLQLVGDFFEDRHEGEIDHQYAVFGMIDDPDDLLGKQPRIDGVINGADAHDAVPGLEMPPGVPGQRRHPIAELDAVLVQPLRDPQRPLAQIGVVGGVKRAFDRTGDDLPLGIIGRGVVEDAITQQRPVLHQPEHDVASHGSCIIALGRGGLRQPPLS